MTDEIRQLWRRCALCAAPLVRIHRKTPFIDDFEDECPRPYCPNHGTARVILDDMEKACARAEPEHENGDLFQ